MIVTPVAFSHDKTWKCHEINALKCMSIL